MTGSSWVKNRASYEGGSLGWVGLGHEPRVVGHVGSWVKHFDPFPTLVFALTEFKLHLVGMPVREK